MWSIEYMFSYGDYAIKTETKLFVILWFFHMQYSNMCAVSQINTVLRAKHSTDLWPITNVSSL